MTGYLEAAFDEMRRRSGTLDRYLTGGLQLDTARLGALRAAFVQ